MFFLFSTCNHSPMNRLIWAVVLLQWMKLSWNVPVSVSFQTWDMTFQLEKHVKYDYLPSQPRCIPTSSQMKFIS